MSHEGTLTLLGILIVLSPFLGLPYSWLMVILPLFGLSVVALSVLLRARVMKEPVRAPIAESAAPTFDESSSIAA